MLKPITLAVVLTLLCICGSLLPAAQDKGDAAKKVLDQFQGTWVCAALQKDGNKPEKIKSKDQIRTITFKGDKFEVKVGGNVVQAGTQKLDAAKSPMTVDATVAEGEGKGTTHLGIFELKGDTLRACFDPQGKQRPTEFKTTPGSGYELSRLLRDVPVGVSRNDSSVIYEEILNMGTGFKSYNGKAYDVASLCVDPKAKIVVPDKFTEVGRHEQADVVLIYMEKRAGIGAHLASPTSIAAFRNQVGGVVKLDNGSLWIGTFGEYSFIEGSVKMKLVVMAPPKVTVDQKAGLIGGYVMGGKKPIEVITPVRDDPKPALTKAKKGDPSCWLAPTVEDGWHEIPAMADPSWRLSKGLNDKK